MSNLRRSMMMVGRGEDYPDVEWGLLFSQTRYFAPLVVTPFVETPSNCREVKLKSGIVFYSIQMQWFDENKVYGGYWMLTSDPRTITFATHYKYLRLTMNANQIDNCYIYDATNGNYLWAGKNVDTSTPPQ